MKKEVKLEKHFQCVFLCAIVRYFPWQQLHPLLSAPHGQSGCRGAGGLRDVILLHY